MENTKSKVNMSISKIDEERVKDTNEYKDNPNFENLSLYEQTKCIIEVRLENETPIKQEVTHVFDWKSHLYFYNKSNESQWKKFVQNLLEESMQENIDESIFLTNFPSFLIMNEVNQNVYVITSGQSNQIVDEIKDKHFGIELISKLVNEDDEVIKHLADNRIYGRRNATKYYNRGTSKFSSERNYESIYNELGTALKSDIQEKIGLPKDKRTISVTFGQLIQIHKALNIQELKRVLEQLDNILENEDYKFVLNYLVPCNKRGYKKKEVCLDFYNSNKGSFTVTYNAELNANIFRYEILNSSGNIVDLVKSCGLTNNQLDDLDVLEKCINNLIKGSTPKTILESYTISTDQYLENLSSSFKLLDLLEQDHTYDDQTFYLNEGNWYVFLEKYDLFLQKEFEGLFDESEIKCNTLFASQHINIDIKRYKLEANLQKELIKNDKVIFSDQRFLNRTEIADFIYLDEDNIYLIHGKTKSDGKGVRDVTGQIETSAELIYRILHASYDEESLFKDYVDKLKCVKENKLDVVQEFKNNLLNHNPKIIYVAVFTSKIDKNKATTYVKYLLDTTQKRLNVYNFDFIFHSH